MDKPSAPQAPGAPIYLSKDGNVSGPFTAEQVEEMKKSGEYQKFNFLWEAQNWVPINAPIAPPAPPGATLTGIVRPAAQASSPAPTPSPSKPSIFDEKTNTNLTRAQLGGAASSPPPKPANTGSHSTHHAKPKLPGKATNTIPGVPAICHNSRSILAGTLGDISKDGCVFRSQETPRSLPEFHKGGKVRLNVLEESSGKSENLDATIQKLALSEGHWEFYLGWERVPVILEHLK